MNDVIEIAKSAEATAGFLSRYNGSTRSLYTGDIKMLFEYLRSRKLHILLVKPIHLAEFKDYLFVERNNQPKSVRRRLGVIKNFYKYCYDTQLVSFDPAATLKLPVIRQDDSSYFGLNRMEMSVLLGTASARSANDGAMVALMMLMGLRVSTACSINVGDLKATEHGHRVIKYMTKGMKLAVAPIPVPIARILDLAAEGRLDPEPLITRRNGRRLDKNAVYHKLKLVVRDAGLPVDKVSPHTLRRSAITAALDSGLDLRAVQQFANHSDIRQTMRYDTNHHNLDKHPIYMMSSLIIH